MNEKTLYESSFEHDACGIGALVNIDGSKTHKIVDNALSIVEKLEHRAGKDASGETGDGVGILLQISHDFFKKEASDIVGDLGERDYGIGMFFFMDGVEAEKKRFEKNCASQGLKFLGWREVPVLSDVLGKKARDCMPSIWQGFIERPDSCEKGLEFDKLLYKLRLSFEKDKKDCLSDETYVCSLSSRTIVYKGMFLVSQLRTFYRDLLSDDYKSAVAIVHSRFSTNTNPSWQRAHPNRFIAHNGEINTIKGNADRMIARGGEIDPNGSDSARLDNTLEYYIMNGLEAPLSLLMCVPQAWKHDNSLSQEQKDFYHYWATMMESWDGPAALLFSDGDSFLATLDRNGLRPSRYYITKNKTLILSSEVGVLDIPESTVLQKSRLEPGKILLVDLVQKKLVANDELKSRYAKKYPYGEWLSQNLVPLHSLKIPNKKIPVSPQEERDRLYKAFGWSLEDVNEMILPMAKNAIEPTGAMGNDIPLAVLSEKHPPLFDYFKQSFAQVTNPPIDSLREKTVTDTTVYVGSDGDILNPCAKNCHVLEINNPILTGVDMLKIKALNDKGLKAKTISLVVEKQISQKESGILDSALLNVFREIDEAYEEKFNIIVLSDRGVDENHIAIPSLLAVSAVEQYLIRTKRRTKISVILESAEIRDVHQAALCLGYGARAVNPYLAHECIAELIDKKLLDKDYHTAIDDYNLAIMNGIVKIAAKMGISTLQSYQSSQMFEAVGLSKKLTEKYFTNTVSRIGGIGIKEIEEDILFHHNEAYKDIFGVDNRLIKLDTHAMHKYKVGEHCEHHLITPALVKLLQESCQEGNYGKFKEYSALANDTSHPHTIRSLFDFNFKNSKKIPLEKVESAREIVKRFKTGAMSYGSISEEAHKCLAEAMNHLHGKSNSGEGGEKSERFGTQFSSAIKQVASGRFGVTEEYLLSAKEIQIKMAQGAKPGEGGHLPGKKVYPWIAQTRYATPGVSLISPPPHHDIYSIEDLAQLIFDLKNANRRADISVKLVSEAGVGTIASGVAKAGANVILISGHDGGTGAAPLSSIHHAGLPWEMGLAETHQTLIQNNLRSLVRLETDGKLMTGRDIAIACMLGAEEFGFATAPLIVLGCKMLRVCNLDTCPFGVATQNDKLRAKFPGKAEYVENFMLYVAEELREIMAEFGISTVKELCGRTDLLKVSEGVKTERAKLIDTSKILSETDESWKTHFEDGKLKGDKETLDFGIDSLRLLPVLNNSRLTTLKYDLECTDRTAGTILGSVIQEKYKNTLEDDHYTVHFTGGAGQSFGAFIPKGLTLRLTGDANDAVGKGLSGGKIVITPSEDFEGKAEDNIIIGNVAFFGATSGKGFINGRAGERFCVRNSGATVVCEGSGDHALEYMTGGTVVILGETGKNVAAGMSGGIAYILDEKHELYKKLNRELVTMYELEDEETALLDGSEKLSDSQNLKKLLEEHFKATNSKKAQEILNDFESYIPLFKKIIPNDYLKMKKAIARNKNKGLKEEEAVLEAFKSMTATI
ncbi:MAG: glutamate synthase large subunit [Treponema sp.]|nr:glutamate synthase large subunit [Treponema sp.]